jgi:hypothetical protein
MIHEGKVKEYFSIAYDHYDTVTVYMYPGKVDITIDEETGEVNKIYQLDNQLGTIQYNRKNPALRIVEGCVFRITSNRLIRETMIPPTMNYKKVVWKDSTTVGEIFKDCKDYRPGLDNITLNFTGNETIIYSVDSVNQKAYRYDGGKYTGYIKLVNNGDKAKQFGPSRHCIIVDCTTNTILVMQYNKKSANIVTSYSYEHDTCDKLLYSYVPSEIFGIPQIHPCKEIPYFSEEIEKGVIFDIPSEEFKNDETGPVFYKEAFYIPGVRSVSDWDVPGPVIYNDVITDKWMKRQVYKYTDSFWDCIKEEANKRGK